MKKKEKKMKSSIKYLFSQEMKDKLEEQIRYGNLNILLS